MSIAARLAKLEEDAAEAGEDAGPLLVFFGCTSDTDPKPRPSAAGDARICLAPGEPLPAWAGTRPGRPFVYIPAETGPNEMPEEVHRLPPPFRASTDRKQA